MVNVIFELKFRKDFKKINNKFLKEKIIEQILKIKLNPEIGKPMRYSRKGTRELHISPYILSYKIDNKIIHILELYHKDKQ